jgi:DNA-binding LytR/AlgR family response regulator
MKKGSILLVEDDHIFSLQLEMMLERMFEDQLEVTRCASAREATTILDRKNFDLLLIDVVLETERAGIQLAKSVNPLQVAIIFITAFQREDLFQHALKTSPTHFLQKPFSDQQLRQAIEVALSRRKLLLETGLGPEQKPILLKRRDGQIERVHQNTIIAIEAYGNYCHFYLTNDRRLTQRMKLKEYKQSLPARNFIQIHRRWVVNLALFERIDKQTQEVTVAGMTFPTGTKFNPELLKSLYK